jgi:muconolactone delta-isomerase
MLYLVDMTVASHPKTPQEGLDLITISVLLALTAAKELEAKGIIVAGGLKTGQIGLAIILKVDSLEQLDEIVERLPIWPRMDTTITPLSTFEVRESSTQKRLADVQRRMQEQAGLKSQPAIVENPSDQHRLVSN